MLRFYLPLAWTAILMMVTHVVVAGGIARTADPKLALAGLALAQGVSVFLEAPLVMARQVAVALVRDPANFRLVARATLAVLAAVTALAVAIAATPLGRLVFFTLLGAPAAVAAHGWLVYGYYSLLPAASAFRSLTQAVAILCRQTRWVFFGMIVRVGIVAGTVAVLAGSRWTPGGAVGAVAITAGIATEAVVCGAVLPGLLRGLRREDPAPRLEPGTVWRFFGPLIAAGMISNLSKPVLNAGLARAADAAIALAALAVAQSVAGILTNPIQMLHQVVLVFERDDPPPGPEGRQTAGRFALAVGLVGAACVAAIGFTPAGEWIFRTAIGTGDDVTPAALGATRWMALLPPILAWQEVTVGRLLLSRRSQSVTASKTVNVAVVGLAIGALIASARSGAAIPGYAAAVLSVAAGHAAEAALATILLQRREPAATRPARMIADRGAR